MGIAVVGVLGVGLTAIGLTGCGGSRPSSVTGGTLIYTRGGDADALDPVMTSSGESVTILANVYDTLVTYDDTFGADAEQQLTIVPSLAESWVMSEDGLTWTFRIRDGVTFHDGSPLTAGVVAFNLRRLQEKGAAYGSHYDAISGIEAPDDRTLVLTVRQPSPLLLKNLAMFPASIGSQVAIEKDEQAFARNPVGTGPFRFQSWVPKQRITLAANEDHWRGAPGVGRVVILSVDESAVRVAQIERGEAHLADNLPPSSLAQLETNPNVRIISKESQNVGFLSINNDDPILKHPGVRQAIAQAIDRQRLCDVVFDGRAIPAATIVPPTVFGHDPTIAERAAAERPFDVAAAKAKLEAAAKAHGFTLPLRLDLFAMQQPRPYMQQPQETANFLRDALRPIGIECQIQIIDLRQYWQRLSRGEHQLALAGWSSDNADADNFLYALLDQDNINDTLGNNTSRYRNDDVHQWLLAAQVETDPEARQQLYNQAQNQIFEETPVVPLVHTIVQTAARNAVENFELHPTSIVRLRQVRLTEGAR